MPRPEDANNKNNAGDLWTPPDGLVELLTAGGIAFTPAMAGQLAVYARMVREWNDFASLVSVRDADLLEGVHLPDSISLAPVIRERCGEKVRLLDIGSGGGLPAIPLKIVLPGLGVEMVERSVKKVGFLEKVCGLLGLEGVRVVHGNFPEVGVGDADVITARAVERPEWLLPRVGRFLKVGAVFLHQAGAPRPGDGFHVEHVEDAWSRSGLRRGELYLIRRNA